MSKVKSEWVCSECGEVSGKWAGSCPGCKAWNSLVERTAVPKSSSSASSNRRSTWAGAPGSVQDLMDVRSEDAPRITSGSAEFDRVLGGGLVEGSVVLIGGNPGIGKSTLLLQAIEHLSKSENALYVTGEESVNQIKLRADRLGFRNSKIRVVSETDIVRIREIMDREKARTVVIDSIQTAYHPDMQSSAGTVAQVRESTALLTQYAKSTGCKIILVGHVTKEDTIAGPKVLEHIVDTCLFFEGENGTPFRMLRAIKNRFGAANEIGVFAMGEKGLEEVTNPSSLFLTQHANPVAGCAVFAAIEGNRPLLVEVQALVEDSPSPNPRRYSSGLEINRLQLLLAILNKHMELGSFEQNVYLKVVGGVRLTEPAADLPILLALYSSLANKPLPEGFMAFGEVGLAGELRPVQNIHTRLKEAARLGFKVALIPESPNLPRTVDGLKVLQAKRVDSAIAAVRAA